MKRILLFLFCGLMATALVACGKSESGQEPKEKEKEMEITQGLDEEMTLDILENEHVQDADVQDKDDEVNAVIELKKGTTKEQEAEIIEKYNEEIQKKYPNKKVNVTIGSTNRSGSAVKVSKLIKELPSEIKSTDEEAVKKAKDAYNNLTEEQKEQVANADKLNDAIAKVDKLKTPQEGEKMTVTVQSLIDAQALRFKANPVTQQLSVLLDSTKLTGDLKGKQASNLELVVEGKNFTFKENSFKPTQFEVANTDFTEAQLTAGTVHVK